MLGVVVEERGGWMLLRVSGEVDMATAPRLRQEFVKQIGAGRCHLVVDLAEVEFIDSTGLGVLIGGLKRARSHDGDLRVTGVHGRVGDVFALTGLSEVLVPIDLEAFHRGTRA